MSEITSNILKKLNKISSLPNLRRGVHAVREDQIFNFHQRGSQRILILLNDEGDLTNSQIAEKLDVRPSSVTAMVNEQEEFGNIEKLADEKDKRVTYIHLTEAGQNKVQERQDNTNQVSEEVFEDFSASELKNFEALLDKLISTNKPDVSMDPEDYDSFAEFKEAMRNMGKEFGPFARDLGHEFHEHGRAFGREAARSARDLKDGFSKEGRRRGWWK